MSLINNGIKIPPVLRKYVTFACAVQIQGSMYRAGGNSTADTATAIYQFLREKNGLLQFQSMCVYSPPAFVVAPDANK